MGINKNNNLMKKAVENSPLSGINKKITNHSAKKTLVKTLKQNKTPKSEINSVTGHNTAYDNGDEEQQ